MTDKTDTPPTTDHQQAPSPTATAASPAGIDVMRRWFATMDASLLAEDIEWLVPGYPVAKERYVGRNAVFGEFFPGLTSQFAEWGADTERMIDGGDDVTVIGRYRGKTMAGTAFEIPFIHVWTVKDGRVVRVVSAAHTKIFADVLSP